MKGFEGSTRQLYEAVSRGTGLPGGGYALDYLWGETMGLHGASRTRRERQKLLAREIGRLFGITRPVGGIVRSPFCFCGLTVQGFSRRERKSQFDSSRIGGERSGRLQARIGRLFPSRVYRVPSSPSLQKLYRLLATRL